MTGWDKLTMSEPIRRALNKMGFEAPTQIQQQVLPAALIKKSDVFGAAETGSGKTLAFLIPIIENLIEAENLNQVEESDQEESAEDDEENDVDEYEEIDAEEMIEMSDKPKQLKHLSAVILAPTRELVMQIHNEFKNIAQFTNYKSVAIIGGMNEAKQERLIKKCPDVVIATPGRYWSLCQRNEYVGDFSRLRNVVIDEIDRMVEKGHFHEMKNILEYIHANELPKLQTLVFSATLTFIVLPNPGRAQKSRSDKLQEIARITRMRQNYKVIDFTNEFATPTTLIERRLNCLNLLEKDTNLYFTLLTHQARTLVFTNSIDSAQRLHRLLTTLKFKPNPTILHAKMQERKRLKNLEKFARTPNSVLLATDVAARGLDIKGIENVIHYQIPRTAEDYVHRSGRTARASQRGMTIMLLDPQDVSRYRKICKNLKRDAEIPLLELDNPKRMAAITNQVRAASDRERLEYQTRKINGRKEWERRMAKEADLMLSDEEGYDSDKTSKKKKKK